MFNLQHVHSKERQTVNASGKHKAGVCLLFSVKIYQIHQTWNLSDTFAYVLPKKGKLWFLLMLRTYSAKVWQTKTLHKNANCSAPKTIRRLTKVANKIHLPYLHVCKKALILIYCWCKSGHKLNKQTKQPIQAELRLQTNKKS